MHHNAGWHSCDLCTVKWLVYLKQSKKFNLFYMCLVIWTSNHILFIYLLIYILHRSKSNNLLTHNSTWMVFFRILIMYKKFNLLDYVPAVSRTIRYDTYQMLERNFMNFLLMCLSETGNNRLRDLCANLTLNSNIFCEL